MRTLSNKHINPSDDFILHKPNSDILPLEELRRKIFLRACDHYAGCLDTVAKYLKISPSLVSSLKAECAAASGEPIDSANESGIESIGFYNLTPALSAKFQLLQRGGHFRSMDEMLNEIADRAMQRYKSKSLAARRLRIEESALDRLLEKPDTALHIVSDNKLDGMAGESIAGQFNPHGLNLFKDDGHIITWEEAEASLIQAAIAHYPSMTEVARRLGMGRSTLYRKMDEYNITQP